MCLSHSVLLHKYPNLLKQRKSRNLQRCLSKREIYSQNSSFCIVTCIYLPCPNTHTHIHTHTHTLSELIPQTEAPSVQCSQLPFVSCVLANFTEFYQSMQDRPSAAAHQTIHFTQTTLPACLAAGCCALCVLTDIQTCVWQRKDEGQSYCRESEMWE